MGPIEKKHSQKLKEEIWLMRLFAFCLSYEPAFLAATQAAVRPRHPPLPISYCVESSPPLPDSRPFAFIRGPLYKPSSAPGLDWRSGGAIATGRRGAP